jgi:hypothetical protein
MWVLRKDLGRHINLYVLPETTQGKLLIDLRTAIWKCSRALARGGGSSKGSQQRWIDERRGFEARSSLTPVLGRLTPPSALSPFSQPLAGTPTHGEHGASLITCILVVQLCMVVCTVI